MNAGRHIHRHSPADGLGRKHFDTLPVIPLHRAAQSHAEHRVYEKAAFFLLPLLPRQSEKSHVACDLKLRPELLCSLIRISHQKYTHRISF